MLITPIKNEKFYSPSVITRPSNLSARVNKYMATRVRYEH